jgi:transcriptional regulator with XRE-family HTH domain
MLGQKIKRCRELKNYTQEFLAAELKISQSTYSRIEANQTDITIGRLTQIAKIFGLKGPEDILCGEHTTFNLNHNTNASGITVNQHAPDYRDDYILALKEQISLMSELINQKTNRKKITKKK